MTAAAQIQRSLAGLVLLVVVLSMLPSMSIASMQRSRGQTVYLSVIPQIQSGPRLKNSYLELLMAVRNTDLQHPVTIQSITYHNASGKIEKKVLSKALTLAPLASHTVLFGKKALAIPDGMSACMIVEWKASGKVSPVLVEGVVIGSGTGWTTGLEFKGVVVEEK